MSPTLRPMEPILQYGLWLQPLSLLVVVVTCRSWAARVNFGLCEASKSGPDILLYLLPCPRPPLAWRSVAWVGLFLRFGPRLPSHTLTTPYLSTSCFCLPSARLTRKLAFPTQSMIIVILYALATCDMYIPFLVCKKNILHWLLVMLYTCSCCVMCLFSFSKKRYTNSE